MLRQIQSCNNEILIKIQANLAVKPMIVIGTSMTNVFYSELPSLPVGFSDLNDVDFNQ